MSIRELEKYGILTIVLHAYKYNLVLASYLKAPHLSFFPHSLIISSLVTVENLSQRFLFSSSAFSLFVSLSDITFITATCSP